MQTRQLRDFLPPRACPSLRLLSTFNLPSSGIEQTASSRAVQSHHKGPTRFLQYVGPPNLPRSQEPEVREVAGVAPQSVHSARKLGGGWHYCDPGEAKQVKTLRLNARNPFMISFKLPLP